MATIPTRGYDKPTGPGGTPIPNSGAQIDTRSDAVRQLGNAITDLGSYLLQSYQEAKGEQASVLAQKELSDFTYGLKYGTKDEEGRDVGPPPPDKHEELFTSKVNEINERYGKELSGRALRLFDGQFQPFAVRNGIQVKTQAAEIAQSEISALGDDYLREKSLLYVNANELEKPQLQQEAEYHIDGLVKKGVWTPEQGLQRKRKFYDDAEKGSFYKIMETNPEAAIMAIEGGEFNNLDADTREGLRHKAYNWSYTLMMRENAQLDRQRVQQERDEKKLQEETAKTAIELQVKKKLTPDWVLANRDNLSLPEYKAFMMFATGKGATHSDVGIMSNLLSRALKGENVYREVVGAGAAGFLTEDKVSHIIEVMSREGVDIKTANWRKSGTEYIQGGLAINAFTSTPADKQKHVDALLEWRNWAITHPKASAQEAEKEYKSITRRYQILDIEQMSFYHAVPKFIDAQRGGRSALDLSDPDSAIKALNEAQADNLSRFKAKIISQKEYDDQVILIGKHLEIMKKAKKAQGEEKK